MSPDEGTRDRPVPRQRIREFLLGLMDDGAIPIEDRIRAAQTIAQIEGYTGAQAGRVKGAKDEVVIIKETPKKVKGKD